MYWISAIRILLNFQTYHEFLGSRGYENKSNSSGTLTVRSMCEVFYASHTAAGREMELMVQKLDDGIAERSNNLGLLRLLEKVFTCHDAPVYSNGYCGLGLGMPHGDHSKIRPFLDQVLGTGDAYVPWGDAGTFWSLEDIRTEAGEFLEGRSILRLGEDSGNFFVMQIHKRALGIDLTEEEAETMRVFLDEHLKTSVLPAIPIVSKVKAIRQQRAGYIELYIDAIQARIDDGTIDTLASEDVLLAANSFLDAIIYAGFPSLSGVSTAVVAVFLNDLGGTRSNVRWDSEVDVGRAIMEAVRVYPPVLGIPYVEGSTRYESLAGYSGYDIGVFGEDAFDYRIRFDTVEEYRNIIINFADRAFPVAGKPETSHICPARSLAYNLLLGFLLELDVESWAEMDDKPDVQPSGSGPSFWDYYIVTKI